MTTRMGGVGQGDQTARILRQHNRLEDSAFCRKILETRTRLLLDELAALSRRPQEDSIHDTRVQSRRMRAALETFEDLFPARRWKPVYQKVRAITKLLGKIRETEVTLALLGELSGDDSADSNCREYLQETIQEKLDKQQGQLKKELRALDFRRLDTQVKSLLASLPPGKVLPQSGASVSVSETKRPPVRELAPGETALQPALFETSDNPPDRARRVLGEHATPIFAFRGRSDFARATDERLHELRIAGKKLRYAMEISDQVWPGGLAKEIALARALQDAGGQYHDWCVLRASVLRQIRRLTRDDPRNLLFQIGPLLAQIEARCGEFRKRILPAVTRLQASLRQLLKEKEPDKKPSPQADDSIPSETRHRGTARHSRGR